MKILNIKDELVFQKTRLINLDEELEKEFSKFLDIYLKDVAKRTNRELERFCVTPTYPMLDKTYKGKHWWEYTDVPWELIDYKMSLENHIECIENLMQIDVQEKIGALFEKEEREIYFNQLKERFDNSYSIKFKMDDIPLEDVFKK